MSNVLINSEIGPLETVIVHRPGAEIELVTPQLASNALFDDILSIRRAREEHDQLTAALTQFATVHEVTDLLSAVLEIPTARRELIEGLCELYGLEQLTELLDGLSATELTARLLLGTRAPRGPYARFASASHYALSPMYNLFFTRDAAICVNDRVIASSMANRTRAAESLIMRAIFSHHPALMPSDWYFDGTQRHPEEVTVEGGDVLVLREDLLLIGQGERTSAAGIDRLIETFASGGKIRRVIVQEIPRQRAFIHFDMVFTLLDHDLCAIYEPVIRGPEASRPVLIELNATAEPAITRHRDLLSLLADLGMPLTPVRTGGTDPLHQAREQWQKGTNFFAMAPGKIIGYARNTNSFRELEAHGFRVVAGADVSEGRVDLTAPGRIAVAMEGAELSRGGGGCRCMTLPVRRAPL